MSKTMEDCNCGTFNKENEGRQVSGHFGDVWGVVELGLGFPIGNPGLLASLGSL